MWCEGEQMLNQEQWSGTAPIGWPIPRELLKERAWVEISVDALIHNVRQLRNLLSPRSTLMAVVKADAYGHGAVTVASTVLRHGITWLGVATVPEGIALRQAGINAPILVMGATNTAEQVNAIAHWQLQPTLCNPKQALVFSETLSRCQQTLSVHLKLDTGMSRLGTAWDEAAEFAQLVHRLPGLEIASVYSHLATADSIDQSHVQQQNSRFRRAIAQIQACGVPIPQMHIANTAAMLSDPHLHYDLVRVGLGIYGLYPAPHLRSVINLKSAMQVKARITQVKTLPPSTGISYGYSYVTTRETRIAVVGIGYADGVPRNLSNRIQVLIQGQRVPQIGTITMDQIMLDVSHLSNVQEGDIVTLLGEDGEHQIAADDWATLLNTISWEVLCGFKHRLPRVEIEQPQELMTDGKRSIS
jgi:alanine racemase